MSQKTIYDIRNKIWTAPKEALIFNPDQSVGNLILSIFHQSPEHITQISDDTGTEVTCKQMHDRTVIMAQHLMKYNLKYGDFVGFMGANTENIAPAVFACLVLGITIIPLPHAIFEKDAVTQFKNTTPKIIFCDGKNVSIAQGAVNQLKRDIRIYTIQDKVDGYDCVVDILKRADLSKMYPFYPPVIDSDQIAVLQCTSGSTGSLKKVPKSHRYIISHYFQGPHRQYTQKFLQLSTIFWSSGWEVLIYNTILQSTRIITSQPIDPQHTVDLINKYQVTDVFLPPFLVSRILELKDIKPLESLKVVLLGATKVTMRLGKALHALLPNGEIYNTYGMTELCAVITFNPTRMYESCGYLMKNFSAKIIDEKGNNLEHGKLGEVCIRDDITPAGYFQDQKRTSELIKYGWLHTSDLGYFNEHNMLIIEDRLVEIMNYDGYYIIPSRIEAIINEVDGVVTSCIVGVPLGDSGNSIVHAFVIKNENSLVTETKVLDYVNARVIENHRIRGGVHFVKEFPVGATGKVDRKKLREMLTENENVNQ